MATFKTYQKVQAYEEALTRHGQQVRWTRSTKCPCIASDTLQPNPMCTICNGRGSIYSVPGRFAIRQEIARHSAANVYPAYTPVIPGTIKVTHQGVVQTLGIQPIDGAYVVLANRLPGYYRLIIDYEFDSILSVEDEDSTKSGLNTLQTVATLTTHHGQQVEGTVASVSKVYNVTRDENYDVLSFYKEYIYLDNMGSWQTGDIMEVSYTYVNPFNFVISGVSPKMRYSGVYIADEADAILLTPYWAKISPDDLFTALTQEQNGQLIIDPDVVGVGGPDVIRNCFDVARLSTVVDVYGNYYNIGTDVVLHERNQILWLTTKPTVKYAVEYYYHPTYRALTNFQTLRHAENKDFVNKVNLKLFDRMSGEVTF